MSEAITILGIAGSLRRLSYNKGLIRAATALSPEGVTIESFDIAGIPLYNSDVEAGGDPEPVRIMKERIRAADALLFATPEYNYSVPGVLKNAIDWASRPPRDSPLRGKPVAVMGASPGAWGTVRAQLALRQSFIFTESLCMVRPEVLVAKAAEKFDAQSELTDTPTREFVRAFLAAFAEWIRRLRRGTAAGAALG
jgi:chromate reductase